VLGVVSRMTSLLVFWVVHMEIARHRQEETLLDRAANLDDALYQAKEKGRNRVEKSI